MEKIGVEAVIEGLNSFVGGMKTIDGSLAGVRNQGTLLQRAFGAVGDVFSDIASFISGTLQHAFGELLADAVQWAASQIRDLIEATFEAGREFQTLEIRLERLNFNELIKSGEDYTSASQKAIEATKEQLRWLQELAVATPYDAQDIANVFTLARSYGFASDEAKDLTETVTNFAAGMGLSSEHIERIIINLGQMIQQGKITGTELRDLGRGSFVPVNDVLEKVAASLGITTDELNKLRTKGLVPAMPFIDAFSELVDERFSGASERMAQTLGGATDNVKDFIKSVVGFNILTPIFDKLGLGISQFASALADPKRWDAVVDSADRIAGSLLRIIDSLFGLSLSAMDMADGVVNAFDMVADWLEENEDVIVQWIMDAATWIRRELIPAIIALSKWIGEVLVPFIRDELVPAVRDIITWLTEHKEEVLKFLKAVAIAFIAWQVIATIARMVIGLIASVVAFMVTLTGAVAFILAFPEIAIAAIAMFVGFFLAAFSSIIAFLTVKFWPQITTFAREKFAEFVKIVSNTFTNMGIRAREKFAEFVKIVSNTFTNMGIRAREKLEDFGKIIKNTFTNIGIRITEILQENDWLQAGWNIMQGIGEGILSGVGWVMDIMIQAASDIWNAFLDALDAHSPSKLFEKAGKWSLQGYGEGILDQVRKTTQLMQGAMAQVAMPALAMPNILQTVTAQSPAMASNVTNTQNYTLNLNSSARTEPIIQDFNMMASLAG